jgi:hypothetical protein
MKQQQKEWKIFGHALTMSELSIAILMLVALLSGVAGIWLGLITNVLVLASIAAIAVLVWRTTIKHKVIRIVLLVIEAFVGLSALGGGIAILQGVVFGFVLPLSWLAGTPFSDYTIPGLALVIVVGGSALLAAATVFIERERAVLVSMMAGLFMAGYEVVEMVSIDSKFGDALPTFLGLQLFYFVLGLAVFGLTGYLWMKEYRSEHFHYRHASHA